MKRILSLRILLLCLCVSNIFAVGGNLGGGDGSETSPYLIQDLDDFNEFTSNSGYWDTGKYTHLETDLDLAANGTYSQAPIGQFFGIFFGNDFKISNLTINGSSGLGFFGAVRGSGYVDGLRLDNVNVVGAGSDIGALAGVNLGFIVNCHSLGDVSSSGTYHNSVGGLVGRNSGPMCDMNCGEVGPAVIKYCSSGGIVINGPNICIGTGGLVGRTEGWFYGGIYECFSTSDVIGYNAVGGLVGYADGCEFVNCYSTGSVSGNNSVGGLVGESIPYYQQNTLYCYSTGSVSGNINVGGFIGYQSDFVYNCFWDRISSGTLDGVGNLDPDGDYIYGKTTVEMHDILTFTNVNWDFSDSGEWYMPEIYYPKLSWQKPIEYHGMTEKYLKPDQTDVMQIDLYNNFDQIVSWSISCNSYCTWITNLTPDTGTLSNYADMVTVAIEIDTTGLAPGFYSHDLLLTVDNYEKIAIPIRLHVYRKYDMIIFSYLAQCWLETNCEDNMFCEDADLDSSGSIDIYDLQLFVSKWLGG